jgi:hypothetical protein
MPALLHIPFPLAVELDRDGVGDIEGTYDILGDLVWLLIMPAAAAGMAFEKLRRDPLPFGLGLR